MLHWNTWWLQPPPGPPGIPGSGRFDASRAPEDGADAAPDWPTDWLGWQTRCWQEWLAYQQSWWRVWTLLTPPEEEGDDRPNTRH